MHGKETHKRRKEEVEKVFCVSAQQDQDTVLDYETYVILKTDSRKATLSKAVQDQSEDKPLPVVLTLTKG